MMALGPQPMRGDLTGIVLAGGASRRMGRDKASLPLGGGRVIDAVVAALRGGGCEPVLIVGRCDNPATLALPTIPDALPAVGPLGGLAAGLRAAPTEYAFCSACDLPLLRPALVRLLAGLARGWDGAVPAFGPRGWQPLCAVYGRSLLPLVEPRLRASAASLALTDLLRQARIRPVTQREVETVDPDLASFENVNTPEDYRRLRARWPADPADGRR